MLFRSLLEREEGERERDTNAGQAVKIGHALQFCITCLKNNKSVPFVF